MKGQVNGNALSSYTDDDFKRTMLGALKLEVILCAVSLPIVWWRFGWPSALLLLVGAGISGSGLWEWLRLMSAVMVRMDAAAAEGGPENGYKPRPMGLILLGFFLRLGLTVVVLYVSLKTLNGSVFAVAAGLSLGVFCLTVEVLRKLKA